MKKKKMIRGAHHTGKIRHSDMNMLMDGMGSKDPHASDTHHSMNSEHGMPHGLSPSGDESGSGMEHGGEGMSSNCEYC